MSTDQKKNRCIFCGKDCSFFAHCDGCCIGCGDGLMSDPRALMVALLDSIKRSTANREDAERWRAFIGTHRVRVIGQATQGEYMHIGIELWSRYAGVPAEESDEARERVTAFADARHLQDATRG